MSLESRLGRRSYHLVSRRRGRLDQFLPCLDWDFFSLDLRLCLLNGLLGSSLPSLVSKAKLWVSPSSPSASGWDSTASSGSKSPSTSAKTAEGESSTIQPLVHSQPKARLIFFSKPREALSPRPLPPLRGQGLQARQLMFQQFPTKHKSKQVRNLTKAK